MNSKTYIQFRKFDLILLISTILLILLGLVVLYSSGLRLQGNSVTLDTSRQLLYAAVGVALLIVIARLDYNVLKEYSKALFIIMIVLLLIVEIFGATRLGATRWISFGFFQFQPSEFAKLTLIVVLAKYFSSKYEKSDELKVQLGAMLYLLPPTILVLAQPDLGTSLVLVVIWLAMALITKVQKRYFVLLALVFIALIPVIYPSLAPYQRQRVDTFLNPSANPATTGYNVNQAIIAVGSGGIMGQGLGSGSQSQGNFLPSQQTDFIFAVLSEKLGFMGSLASIVLYCVIVFRAIVIARLASNRFGTFLAMGIAAMFGFHVIVNISMNIGLLPVTGIPLPLISAGGTSMIISLISIGILQSIYARKRSLHLDSKEVYE